VLELAVRESIRLQHEDLRTEHLLLGLVREGEGVAAQILVQRLGVDLPRVTQTVLDLLKDGGPRTPDGPPTG
jgi:ATP-dependent Clp protease ATP-binding subunit ClpC